MPPPPIRAFQPAASYNPPSPTAPPPTSSQDPKAISATPIPYPTTAYLLELERRASLFSQHTAPLAASSPRSSSTSSHPASTRTRRAEAGWVVLAKGDGENALSTLSTGTFAAEATSLGALTSTPALQGPLARPLLSFPDWPPVLGYFLVGWLLVLWGVGVVLYFATFAHQVGEWGSWVRGLWPARWLGKLGRRGRRMGRGDGDRGSTAVSESVATEMLGLGITTSASYPSNALPSPGLRRRRSLDLEAARSHTRLGEPSTAPLPSSRSFASPTATRNQRGGSEGDLESGTHTPSLQQVQRQRGADEGRNRRGGFAGFLESVNAGIEWVAWRVARTALDQVNGAEEGLLLPVRDGEREGRAR